MTRSKSSCIFLTLFFVLIFFKNHPAVLGVNEYVYNVALGFGLFEPFVFYKELLKIFTFLGYGVTIAFVASALFVILKIPLLQGLGFLALLLVNPLVKLIFNSSRPYGVFADFLVPATSSFPSGHAVGGVLLFVLLPKILQSKIQKSIHGSVFFLFYLGSWGVAFSRVFLGVHWLYDVLVGHVFGLFLMALYLLAVDKLFLCFRPINPFRKFFKH